MGAYTTKDLIATAYFSYSSFIVGRVAGILGKDEEAAFYLNLSEKIKVAFNEEYVTPNGRLVSHTQTAYTLALAFDMLDELTAAKAARHLGIDVRQFGHITTGFLGTPLIAQTLSDHAMLDEAYFLLMRKDYPSWLYPVTMGATTIWERWDGQKPDSTFQDPGMNSFNHYAYGAIGNWLYTTVAGIGIDENKPGYKHIRIRPQPGGGLSHARARLETPYGQVSSGWMLEEGSLRMDVEIPANSSATLYIPGEASGIQVDGRPLEGSELDYVAAGGEVQLHTGSGTYRVTTKY
jgi:alpha-L-rhamnosidase